MHQADVDHEEEFDSRDQHVGFVVPLDLVDRKEVHLTESLDDTLELDQKCKNWIVQRTTF